MFGFCEMGLYIWCKILYSAYIDFTTSYVLVSSPMDTEASVLTIEIREMTSGREYNDVLLSLGIDTTIAYRAIGSVSPRHAYVYQSLTGLILPLGGEVCGGRVENGDRLGRCGPWLLWLVVVLCLLLLMLVMEMLFGW
jgi:hypothetical protein